MSVRARSLRRSVVLQVRRSRGVLRRKLWVGTMSYRAMVAAVAVFGLLTSALVGCTSHPTPAPSVSPSSDAPTDVPEEWPFEADPASEYGLPPLLGLEPEVQPETRVLDTGEADALSGVEILNGDECLGRTTALPLCEFRIVMDPVPADVEPGTVLVSGIAPAAPNGFLVRVTEVDGDVVLADEAGLGDALAQGEFRVEQQFTADQVTDSELTPGVTRLPDVAGGGGTSVAPGYLYGEGMAFHYGVDVTPAPGVRITGEVHFSAGCGVDGGLTYWEGIVPDGAWFDASCHLDQAARFDVSVSSPADGAGGSFQLAKEYLTPIYFQVGPVPVVIVPEVVVSVQLDGTLAVDVGFGAQESVIAAVGVGYHGEFMPYAHFDADSDSHYQLPTGTVGATVGGDLGIRMMLYGILGPEIRGLGYVTFTGGLDPTPQVSYKIRVAVGASIVLDFGIASWDWGPYLFIDKTFNQGSSVYHAPTVAISWPTEGQTISLGSVLVPRLTAVASDEEDGTLPVSWSSDVDGYLGAGTGPVTASLTTPGAHTLTASTVDADGMAGQAVVHVTVEVPTLSLATAVTDLGGQPISLTGPALWARQGEVYFIEALPSAPQNVTAPSCTAVTWDSDVPLEDKGNCLARITLDTQGTFSVMARLATPWGGTVTSSVVIHVGPPPATVSPVFEGITAQSAGLGVLTTGDSFFAGDALTLTMRYLNAAQAATPVTYAWDYQMDGGPWVALPAVGRAQVDVSSRQFSYSAVKTNHTFTFRCIVTAATGGATVTTRTISLSYLAPPA